MLGTGQRGRLSCVMAVPLFPAPGKCFLYCNGLMDHLYVCQNGNGCSAWYKAPGHFTGTLVGAPGRGRGLPMPEECWGVGWGGCLSFSHL